MGIYKEGQIVPFITRRVLYNPAQTAASVEALPFAPEFPDTEVYSIIAGLSGDEDAKAAYLFDKLDALLATISERIKREPSEKKAFDFFQDLIYPFKKATEKKLARFAKSPLVSLTTIKTGYIYQPVESNISDREFYYAPEPTDLKEPVHETNIMFVIDKILNRTIQHYSALIEFVDVYPTFAKVQEYKDIWRMYNMLKR